MEKVTFTPSEFAAVFGKERTWAYRQLYAGKVQALTELGRTLIPKSEVDRLLQAAGRYVGAGAKVQKSKQTPIANSTTSVGAKNWAQALKQRKKPASPQEKGGAAKSRKSATPSEPVSKRKLAYQRMSKPRSAGKSE